MDEKKILILVLLGTLFSVKAERDIDSVRVNDFMEGLIASKLMDNNIAGATACIVKEGEVLLLRGYGYSDLEEQLPVNPNETLFRIGSISKMFTWIAALVLLSFYIFLTIVIGDAESAVFSAPPASGMVPVLLLPFLLIILTLIMIYNFYQLTTKLKAVKARSKIFYLLLIVISVR